MPRDPADDLSLPSSTQANIVRAFSEMAMAQRYDRIRIGELIARSGVGRSTFYDHFRGKEDVLLAAMQPVILALATAASGRAARSYVRGAVEHLWDRRGIARSILNSRAASVVQRRLTTAIASHGRVPEARETTPYFAVAIAAAQLELLRVWLSGQVPASVDTMTDQLLRCARLRDDPPE